MKLHEEFKLYETMWEATEIPSDDYYVITTTGGGRRYYIRNNIDFKNPPEDAYEWFTHDLDKAQVFSSRQMAGGYFVEHDLGGNVFAVDDKGRKVRYYDYVKTPYECWLIDTGVMKESRKITKADRLIKKFTEAKKEANSPMADRLSINTTKVAVQESTPKVVRKKSDDLWTVSFKNDTEHPIFTGDKARVDAFYDHQKDTPVAKARGGLVIKQGGEYCTTMKESAKKHLTEARSVADIEAEIARLQQELEQAKVAEKKASYGGTLPKTVWTWDIYLEPTEKGTWTGIENDLVFETEDEALDAAWVLLNELDDEGELRGDPDDYYVEAFEIPLGSVSKEVLKYSNLTHLI